MLKNIIAVSQDKTELLLAQDQPGQPKFLAVKTATGAETGRSYTTSITTTAPTSGVWKWRFPGTRNQALQAALAANSVQCPFCFVTGFVINNNNVIFNNLTVSGSRHVCPEIQKQLQAYNATAPVPAASFAAATAEAPSVRRDPNAADSAVITRIVVSEIERIIPNVVEATRKVLKADSGIKELYDNGAKLINDRLDNVQERIIEHLKDVGVQVSAEVAATISASVTELRAQLDQDLEKQIEELAEKAVSSRIPVEHIAVSRTRNADGTEERIVGTLPPGMMAPKLDPDFVMTGDTIRTVETAIKMADEGKYVLILVTGPHGSGKSSLARQIAAKRNGVFGVIPFGAKQEAREIVGEMKYHPEKGTYFQEGLFPSYTSISNATVLCDEFNRVENPKVHGPLFNWLQEGTYTTEDGLTFDIAPGVIIVATVNEGYDYAGADNLDIALRGRFFEIQMHMPTARAAVTVVSHKVGVSEDEINRLLTALGANRTLPDWMTMRGLLKAAELIKRGLSWRLSISAAFNTMEEGKRNDILVQLQQSHSDIPDDTYRVWA